MGLADFIEKAIFRARWLLAPMYAGLILVLAALAYKFVIEIVVLFIHIAQNNDHKFIIDLLGLLDLVLLGNLILIVLFAGYENFVSKIEAAEGSVDRPNWMGTVDFSGLKIKLIGSLVAISVIELLANFIELSVDPQAEVGQGLLWRIIIHLTFVVSGVLFAVMDWISDNRVIRTHTLHESGQHLGPEEATTGAPQQNAETGKVTKPGSGI
jgi:uncharacterized protein (TIGR00645 family)